jgi:hypothetical protein
VVYWQLEEKNRSRRAEQEEQERKAAKFKARVAARSASMRLSTTSDSKDGAGAAFPTSEEGAAMLSPEAAKPPSVPRRSFTAGSSKPLLRSSSGHSMDAVPEAGRQRTPEEQMADRLLAKQQQYLQQLAEKRRKEKENEEAEAEAAKHFVAKVA